MSWSFSALGKPEAVAKKAEKTKLESICVSPEESIRQSALDLIAQTCRAYPEGTCVRVEAGGHQSGSSAEKAHQVMKIDIQPLYGFVE